MPLKQIAGFILVMLLAGFVHLSFTTSKLANDKYESNRVIMSDFSLANKYNVGDVFTRDDILMITKKNQDILFHLVDGTEVNYMSSPLDINMTKVYCFDYKDENNIYLKECD